MRDKFTKGGCLQTAGKGGGGTSGGPEAEAGGGEEGRVAEHPAQSRPGGAQLRLAAKQEGGNHEGTPEGTPDAEAGESHSAPCPRPTGSVASHEHKSHLAAGRPRSSAGRRLWLQYWLFQNFQEEDPIRTNFFRKTGERGWGAVVGPSWVQGVLAGNGLRPGSWRRGEAAPEACVGPGEPTGRGGRGGPAA